MTNFKTDNSNSTLWTADVITAKFVKKKKKTEQDNFLAQIWPKQTFSHKWMAWTNFTPQNPVWLQIKFQYTVLII